MMDLSFTACADLAAPAVVVGVSAQGDILAPPLGDGPVECLQRALAAQRACDRFRGRLGDVVEIVAPPGLECRRLIAVCLGDLGALDDKGLQKVGGAVVARLAMAGERHAHIAIDSGVGLGDDRVSQIAFGARLRNYLYACDRSRPAEMSEPVRIEKVTILARDPEAAAAAYAGLAHVADGVHLARDLVNAPPNRLYPASFAEQAKSLSEFGLDVQVLEPDDIKALGMNALLAVGEGSVHRPRLLVLRWNGAADPGERPVALVGKGITFDSGGLIVKPLEWMKGMKGDMAGGAAVVGTLLAAAGRQLPANIVGVVPLAENAVSGSAYRPSDVIRTACGVSIEVLHTDAEGRLVLMDGVWYARAQGNARLIVSIGTVTGSGLFGLGRHYAGLYTTDEQLAASLIASGEAAAEPLWRLPLSDAYDEDLLSDIADYRQQAPFMHGADGTYVARLLRHAAADVPWAQIEMCGLEFNGQDTLVSPKGASGYGVRLLSQFASSFAKGEINENS